MINVVDALAKIFLVGTIGIVIYGKYDNYKINKNKKKNLLSMQFEYKVSKAEERMLKDMMLMQGYSNEGKYIRDKLKEAFNNRREA